MKKLIFDFFFQAEDGIRDADVTGVQTCALPIWPGDLGNPADGLPPYPPGSAQPRTPWLPPGCQLFLVHVQRQPPEVPADAQEPDEALACGAHPVPGPGRSLGVDC